jgi:hypothetical protein
VLGLGAERFPGGWQRRARVVTLPRRFVSVGLRTAAALTLVAALCLGGCSRRGAERDALAPYSGTPPTPAQVQRAVERERASAQHDLDKIESKGQQEVDRERRRVEREQARWSDDGEHLTKEIVDKDLREAEKREKAKKSTRREASNKPGATAGQQPQSQDAARTASPGTPERALAQPTGATTSIPPKEPDNGVGTALPGSTTTQPPVAPGDSLP